MGKRVAHNRLTHEEYLQRLENNGIKTVIPLEKYAGLKVPLLHRCLLCGNEWYVTIPNLLKQINDNLCPCCSDKFSFCSKIMNNILAMNGINYKTEARFSWSNKKRYDFYIESKSCIIETHGMQHYNGGFYYYGGKTKEQEQKNDELKHRFAKDNGIQNYFIIDCRYSDFDYIKNSITKSGVLQFLGITMTKNNWDICFEKSMSSKIVEACNIWNSEKISTIEIGKIMGVSYPIIRNYLKLGTDLGICDYTVEQSKAIKNMNTKKSCNKKCILLNTFEIFDSITDASQKYGVSGSSISQCCKNIRVSAGRHCTTNDPLIWQFYNKDISNNEYMKIYNNKIDSLYFKKVRCVNTNELFDSASEAAKYFGMPQYSKITACVRGERDFAGKHPITGEKLVWKSFVNREVLYASKEKNSA